MAAASRAAVGPRAVLVARTLVAAALVLALFGMPGMLGRGRAIAASRTFEMGTDRLMTGTAVDIGLLVLQRADLRAAEPILVRHRELDKTVVISGSTTWAGGSDGRIGVRFRMESQSEGMSTRPLIDVIELFAEGTAPCLPAGEMRLEFSHTSFAALDVTGYRTFGPWDVWGTASLLAPHSLVRASAVGLHDPRGVTISFLQFVSYRAESGIGFSLGGGIRYRGERYELELEGTDAVAGLYFRQALMERGFVRADREAYDEDGYIITLPLVTGRVDVEPRTFRPWAKWRVRVALSPEDEANSRRVEAELRGAGSRYVRVDVRLWLDESRAVSLGGAVPYGGIDLGVRYREWELGLTFGAGVGFTVTRQFVY